MTLPFDLKKKGKLELKKQGGEEKGLREDGGKLP